MHTISQYGEFGQKEYSETTENLQESLVQLNFQLVRTTATEIHILEKRVREILQRISQDANKEFLGILFKMTLYVRDIVQGKGECLLFYMMVLVWYEFYPDCAKILLHSAVTTTHGSWKDIKYFCKYCLDTTKNNSHPMIEYAIFITNNQLKNDYYDDDDEKGSCCYLSFVAKWIPREKSKKFGWLFQKMALSYFSNYIQGGLDKWRKIKAKNKAYMNYRSIISTLNKKLDTVQIKQCEQMMDKIDYSKVSATTMMKQRKAFLNLTKNGKIKFKDYKDVLDGASSFKEFILSSESINGKKVTMEQFAREVVNKKNGTVEKDLINKMWKNNALQTKTLRNMIPILDCSQKMFESGAIYGAMALACRIAENSLNGKRILCFSSHPVWVNLSEEECSGDFTSMMNILNNKIKNISALNCNLHDVVDMLLETIVDCKMTTECVENMMLVVISSMQTEKDKNGWTNCALYNMIKNKYRYTDPVKKIDGTSYDPPHILFWNMVRCNGFPVSSNKKNVSMMSGLGLSPLNLFGENDSTEPKICTPWSMLCNLLNKKRYNVVKNRVTEYWETP